MNNVNNQDKNIHRSTTRVLDILELIAANPSMYSLTEICEQLNSPKSSLYPILYTLTKRHFLALDNANKYRIAFSAYQVGSSYLSQMNFLDEVEKIMVDLTEKTSETSHFATLAGGDVLYLKKIDSPEAIRMTSFVGNRIPAYGTALGKALLADMEMDDLTALYPDPLIPMTSHTITNLDSLLKQLHQSRITGFTYEIEESNQYIRCYAVPIRKNGTIVAAISVAIPIFRYSDEKGAYIRALLFESKNKLEILLNSIDTDFQNLI